MPRCRIEIKNNKLYASVIILPIEVPPTPENLQDEESVFRALFDTGATATAITKRVVKQLKLKSKGKAEMRTATKTESVNSYQVSVVIRMLENEMSVNEKGDKVLLGAHLYDKSYNLTVSELRSDSSDFDVLLGMDIISQGLLIVDGDHFTFAV